MGVDENTIIPVKVAVRVRPLIHKEKEEGASISVQCFEKENQVEISGRFFAFDFIFGPDSSQQSLYELCGAPLLEKLFKGYNCTVFAYGQTGSGKTYTMGTEETSASLGRVGDEGVGLIPQIVTAIFRRATFESDNYEFHVKCSMLEIYEERVLDLLAGDRNENLQIRESNKGGIFVQDLTSVSVEGLASTIQLLEKGSQIRSKGETAMNTKSSRSHAVFSLTIEKTAKTESAKDTCQATLHLVDLAGSERLKKTQASGERMKEGIKINEGLLALGSVISALTDPSQNRSHIPYRDSKLTRLLQADSNSDETLSTLRYAERAKKIKNKPVVNRDPNAAEIQRLKNEVHRLKLENLQLRTEGGGGELETRTSRKDMDELDSLRIRNSELVEEAQKMRLKLAETVAEKVLLMDQIEMAEEQGDTIREQLKEFKDKIGESVYMLDGALDENEVAKLREFVSEIVQEIPRLSKLTLPDSTKKRDHDLSDDDEGDGEGEMDEDYPEQFVKRQSAVSQQIQNLLEEIKNKEALMQETTGNSQRINEMQQQHEREMVDLKHKIEEIQKQRDELNQQLKKISITSKLSEERRRKLNEMERELTENKKKLRDMQKLEKLKVQSEQSIKKHMEEIQELKCLRIKLVKQLRQESETFRKWKVRSEKEMNQLKIKERKRAFEAEKEKRTFTQLLEVNKRKYQEAVAFGKRLQQQINRQQTIQRNRITEKNEKEMKSYLEEELELAGSTEEARLHCDFLIEQRKGLNLELQKLKRRRTRVQRTKDGPPHKKVNLGGGRSSEGTGDEMESLQNDIEDIEAEVALRTEEIHELQQKMTEFDSHTKNNNRWCNIHTTAHAKCALELLFNIALGCKITRLQSDVEASDMKSVGKEVKKKLKEKSEEVEGLKKDMDNFRHQHSRQLNKQQQEHQWQVSYLLNQMGNLVSGHPLDPNVLDRVSLMCNNLDSVQDLQDKLEKVNEEKEEIQEELSRAKVKGKAGGIKLFKAPKEDKGFDSTFTKPQPIKRSRSSRLLREPERLGNVVVPSPLHSDGEEENDVGDYDSDYRETPISKRTKSIRAAIGIPPTYSNDENQTSCHCRGNCGTGHCRCKKEGSVCVEGTCRCKIEMCTNRDEDTASRDTTASEDGHTPLNETFVKTASADSDDQDISDTKEAEIENSVREPLSSRFRSPMESGLMAVRTTNSPKRFFKGLGD